MQIPTQLKIGGHTVEVKITNAGDANGLALHNKSEIHISEDLPQSHKEAALLHEVMHFLCPTLGDEHLGHSLQDSLSEQLYQVLSDNDLLK